MPALSRIYPAFSFDGRTCNGGGLASLTRTVLPVGRCSTGPVIQRIRTWLLGAEKHFWALYVCIWYTGQALSQLQRLCPALPGVCQPPSSVRGTCIVVPHAALLAVPDAPPRFFAHRARSAPVPLTPPWPHLAKYNAARWLIAARARTPGRSDMASLRPPDAAMASPSQVQCCTLTDRGPGAHSRAFVNRLHRSGEPA